MQLNKAILNRIFLENYKYCWTNNLCFYCKEQDYNINTCEKKVMTDAQNTDCDL
jgi:hypothetical protein